LASDAHVKLQQPSDYMHAYGTAYKMSSAIQGPMIRSASFLGFCQLAREEPWSETKYFCNNNKDYSTQIRPYT